MQISGNWIKSAIVIFTLAVRLFAVEVGDSRETVIKELGSPAGRIEAVGAEILRYPELTIRLKKGRVVAVNAYTPPPAPTANSSEIQAPLEVPRYKPEHVELHLSKHFVGTPEIETSKGTLIAGTAFMARRRNDSQVYVLTAHHLFSPMGGLSDTISHTELPNVVRGFRILELYGDAKTRPITGCYVPEGTDPKEPQADLAIFKTSGVEDEDAPLLAETTPSPGDSVWIVAEVRGGVPKGTFVHRAEVIRHNSSWLVCVFENSQIILNGASGAPVLDSDSRVVGVYSGHAEANGRKYAFVIPASLILKTIREL